MSPRTVPALAGRRLVSYAFAALLVGLGVAAAGCPIYAADSCSQDPACVKPQPTGTAEPYDTGVPPDDASTCAGGCSDGYVCNAVGTGRYACVPYDCRAAEKSCTAPATCSDLGGGVFSCSTPAVPDCTKTGCIAGMTCAASVDGKSHACVSTDPNACVVDSDCPAKTGAGSLCLGGVCKAPKDLCSDSTQCKAGSSCLDGRCEPKCTSTASPSTCSSGYTCDAKTATCSGGGGACGGTSAGDAGPPATCGSGTTCVGTRCVEPCATDGSCKAGLVCVGGGCVVDDRPIFFCDKGGTADGKQDVCASGSVCLHHNCYIACTGPSDTTTCATADKFPVCKSVTTSSGSHDVCGSATNLGTECDPTTSPPKTCSAGKACVDGFCK